MSRASDNALSLGQCAQLACIWEATARKAGNVHRLADFADLTYLDFVQSAMAIAPIMEQAPRRSVGETVIEAMRATRSVSRSNSNLGIVLLLAPLAKAGLPLRQTIDEVLDALTVEDARLVYEAIRLARPGGMGKVSEQDVSESPTGTLREVMGLAAGRDRIARQYICGFADVFDIGLPALREGFDRFGRVEPAIIHCQLRWLSALPDSLIARKRGLAEAEEASARAREVLAAGEFETASGRARFTELDCWLRAEGHSRNPGTTADLVTACLFVALRDRTMDALAPFAPPLF